MKTLALLLFLAVAVSSCMGQGAIYFNNRSIGNVVAPIYGPKTNAPFTRLSGNAVTNGGSTDYTGYPLLFGTGYTAELWAETSAGNDIFAPLAGVAAKVQFRTAATLGGFLQNSGASILVPFVPGPANSSWRFQVRAWDNGGSFSSSFDDAFFAGRAAGISDIFTSPVIAGPSTPGQIVGFTSFNLVLQLPRFTVSGSAVGDGTVTLSPLKLTYATGEVVQVTATPGRWQAFTHWNDGATDNPRSVIAESNMTLTAYFSPTSVVVSASSVGNGAVALAPFRILYSTGEVVQATATAARWHAFTQWNDGAITNPRFIIAASNAVFTAYFAPTQALETLTYGNVSRLAPVGMPAVFVGGTFIVESNASARGSAAVSLATTFGNGTLLYTLDGSTPDFSSRYFDGPFEVKRSSTLRAVAYNSGFTQSQQADPVEIIILPTVTTHAAGGGSVTVGPPAGAYYADGTATVTATPAPGWTFLKWLGDASGTNLTTSVSVSRNRCVEWCPYLMATGRHREG